MKPYTAEIMPLYAVPEEDVKLFVEWVFRMRHENVFDMKVMSYTRACLAIAKAGEETVLMTPIHPVLMIESIARKEDMQPREVAMSMYKIGVEVDKAMHDTGMLEAYTTVNDDRVANIMVKNGWEEVKGMRVLRRKLDPPDYMAEAAQKVATETVK